MSEGYVYVLSNPSMPGLVKIGKTTREPAQRANELYQTGVPERFALEGWVLSPDCHELERFMHEEFEDFRVGQDREFFRADAPDACDRLDMVLAHQVSQWVDRYLPEHEVCHADLGVTETDVANLAAECGEDTIIVADFLRSLRGEQIKQAVAEFWARRQERAARIRAEHEAKVEAEVEK